MDPSQRVNSASQPYDHLVNLAPSPKVVMMKRKRSDDDVGDDSDSGDCASEDSHPQVHNQTDVEEGTDGTQTDADADADADRDQDEDEDDNTSQASQADDPLTANIKNHLRSCLSQVNSIASFASFGTYSDTVNPGLSVQGIGGIGLPLSQRDACALSKISHVAPYGKGSKTLIDSAIRNTRELNVDQFSLQNPRWETTLDGIKERVAVELGVPVGRRFKAVLYKMLLYREGALFKPHRDSEKIPLMFGTLVICLPSQHKGGEVHLRHGEQEKILRTAETSEHEYSYLCWYADVQHEITEVTEGSRLVLTYNLVFEDNGFTKLAADIGSEKKELEETFACWRANVDGNCSGCPKMLVYLFEHLYTQSALRYGGLKGNDQVKGQYFQELCEKYDFLFWLGSLERGIEGKCEDTYGDGEDPWRDLYYTKEAEPAVHDIEEVREEWLNLALVVDKSGSTIITDVPLAERDIVQENPFRGDPSFEEWTGPTGNEGVSAVHYYHRSVGIIMPKEYRNNFLFNSYIESKRDMSSWLRELIAASDRAEKTAEKELVSVCQLIIEGTKDWIQKNKSIFRPASSFGDALLGVVIEASMHLNDPQLCDQTLQVTMDGLPQPVTVKAIRCFGIIELRKSLSRAIRRFQYIIKRLEILNGIYETYMKQELPDLAVLEWIREETEISFLEGMLGPSGGANVFHEVILRYGDGFILHHILPSMRKNISNIDERFRPENITLEFLNCIFEAWDSRRVALKTSRIVFSTLLDSFVQNLTVEGTRHSNPKRISRTYTGYSSAEPRKLISLLRQCRLLALEQYRENILDKLKECARNNKNPPIAFATYLLPIARDLYDTQLSLDSDQTRTFIKAIIAAFRDRCVGSKPSPSCKVELERSSSVQESDEDREQDAEGWQDDQESDNVQEWDAEEWGDNQRQRQQEKVDRWQEDQSAARSLLERIFGKERLENILGERFEAFLKDTIE